MNRVRLLSISVQLACLSCVTASALAQSATQGVIQGHVLAVLGAPAATLGGSILVPGVDVWARNLKTGTTSPHTQSNAEGFFRTTLLDPGEYQVCESAPGYISQCLDLTVAVSSPVVVLPRPFQIRPSKLAVHGTVWLADGTTPCFWFRPAFDTLPLSAKVSLVDAGGKTVAGPVLGNLAGQYVVPVVESVPRGAKLHVECQASVSDLPVPEVNAITVRDVILANHAPTILALAFTQGGVGVRRADVGATVTATVQTSDLDGDTLHYQWVDSSGRSLGLPDAPSVSWPLPSVATRTSLQVRVTDGRGGVAETSRTIETGPNQITFTGTLTDRGNQLPIGSATVLVNGVSTTSNAQGVFTIKVPDAPQFVLNVKKPGFALHSEILRNLADNIQVPLDAVQTATVNGTTGGSVSINPPGICDCKCKPHGHGGDHDRDGPKEKIEHALDPDYKHKDRDDDHDGGGRCGPGGAGATLNVRFAPRSFVTASGAAYGGTVSVEGFQYDLNKPHPIPGDFGAKYGGNLVRLGSFGAFHILPRDASGKALAMAPGRTAAVSLPIQPGQLAAAPATIPFFSYDETSGLWVEEGMLTRSGSRYNGSIKHFSAFNADTTFSGGACLRVQLVGFTPSMTLDASYYDPAVGAFNHNGTTTSDTLIGVERMAPNQSFNLTIVDSSNPPSTVTVALFSGPGLNSVLFPGGLDTDQVNFSHCNGPVVVYNNGIPGTQPNFLNPVFNDPVGTFKDNSAAYQKDTQALPNQARNTLNGWKTLNGFSTTGVPAPNEARAIYFNDNDLEFGRDMHCLRNTATGGFACYVTNFGTVGTEDAPVAVTDAINYESSGQTSPAPTATVAMEYTPGNNPTNGVQFFAYDPNGHYLAKPQLDSQGPKPMPDMCMACHFGSYSPGSGNINNGAHFLPFDLASFRDQNNNFFGLAHPPSSQVQEQFRQLNNVVASTGPSAGITTLLTLWYPGGVGVAGQQFSFTQHAAQLPAAPFLTHEPLYDNLVAVVCRTCHVSLPSGLEWDTFAQMSTGIYSSFIPSIACGPELYMPHAQVPWLRYWSRSLSSTLSSELSFASPCLNH